MRTVQAFLISMFIIQYILLYNDFWNIGMAKTHPQKSPRSAKRSPSEVPLSNREILLIVRIDMFQQHINYLYMSRSKVELPILVMGRFIFCDLSRSDYWNFIWNNCSTIVYFLFLRKSALWKYNLHFFNEIELLDYFF